MKRVILLYLAIILGKGKADSEIANWIASITDLCSNENGVLADQMNEYMSKDELPESNADFIKFYDCLMSNLGMFNENNEVHFESVPNHAPEYIIERFGNIETKLILEAFDYCNSQPKASPRALDAIKRRNCGLKYIKNKLV